MVGEPAIDAAAEVAGYLRELQQRICTVLEALESPDGGVRFAGAELVGERGGTAWPRVLEGGAVIERAAVSFSSSAGETLPGSLLDRRPELRGRPYRSASLSVIVHPRNPYAPASHHNSRFFWVDHRDGAWWFGGGADLTPIYGFAEDAVHWHRTLRAACAPFGDDLYPRWKRRCDEYYTLPHRNEARGIGGLFFDRLEGGGFERCFAIARSLGDAYLPAYLPILESRIATPWGARERDFQLHRRGRYVEFNLLLDRGTRYGLEAGVRADSLLASLPPLASWRFDYQAEPGSPEARLVEEFLTPRDWRGDLDR